MSNNALSRRTFVKATGVVAATTAFTAKSYANIQDANERIGVGLIGAGGIGAAHVGAVNAIKEKENVTPVVVADCWKTRAEEQAKNFGAPLVTTNYKEVLDNKDVDYVIIATPEHQHEPMALAALDAGKAVYCEKPLTHTLEEARAVVKKQKETGLPFQVGVQGMSDDSYETAGQAIREGLIGQVVQAQIEYVRRYGEQGPWRVPGLDSNMPKPEDLNWADWLGDAPKTDWNPHHYFEWRNYSMYSGGICTDLFIHRITRIMKACDLLYPRRVAGMGGIWQWADDRDLPDNFEMICEYPRGMTVYVLGTMSNRVGVDHLIRGYRGTLYFTPTGWVAKDKDDKVLAEHTKSGGEDQSLHHTNLLNAIRKGEELKCPASLGLAGVAAVTMANACWQTGRMMAWDFENEKVVPADTIEHSPYPDKNV